MIFYALDRNKSLAENQSIELKCHNDISPKILQEHVNILFPEGVTKHGDTYFLDSYSKPSHVNGLLELIFEYVRSSYFQNKPSRFQSIFAFKKLEDVAVFIKKIGYQGEYKIWKVECSNFFKADMNLLKVANSNLEMSKNVHLYWDSKPVTDLDANATSLWEYLLVPPVKVISEVKLLK